LQDNNDLCRNSLQQTAYAGLPETLLLLLHFKDKYIIVFYISLEKTICKYCLKEDI